MKPRVKAGTSKAAAAKRREIFARAYVANGMNASQAALTAGFEPANADIQAARVLKDVRTQALISTLTMTTAQIVGLDPERTMREIARLAYSDPRKFYDENGAIKSVHELDDDSAATLASIETEELFEGRGEYREQVGVAKKLKLWDKNAALDKAMKYHGLYERDNAQRADSLNLQVVMVKR